MADENTGTKPTVSVVGCGYVGVTTAAVLANCGFHVQAIESNPERLKILQTGKSFFYEAGVDELLTEALRLGNISFKGGIDDALSASDFVFSCVGTPDNPDGSSNLTFVHTVANQAAQLMKPGSVFIQKSTVPVGTGKKLQPQFAAKNISYVSNPEFLREGTAILDTLWFDRIVAGANELEAAKKVLELYADIEVNRDAIAQTAKLEPPKKISEGQFISTSLASAELLKVTANAFLALKISFANSIAKLSDASGADITEVMDAVGADARIGRAFLNAGRGFGGGCFPKDVSGLIRSAQDYGVAMEIMEAAAGVNESMPHYILHQAEKAFGSDFANTNVAVLGLAFKAGTSDVRRSPAIAIANALASRGASVTAFDPEAAEEAREYLNEAVTVTGSAEEAAGNAQVLFVTTEWPQFSRDIASILEGSSVKLVVDCMNCLADIEPLKAKSIAYLGVGKR